MFGQLSNRDSLRDLTSIISAHSNKAYHLGFGKNVTRSNLAKVNERREPRIFEEFAYHMIDIARRRYTTNVRWMKSLMKRELRRHHA